ncbi:SUKH-4 family immunity protein [Streptomyces kronopolitis]|uniref:SUKH-4 family immunity protein n=1 Tax=Streptomyces kronopolitis TaxID=1612435 RepID=UPI0020BF8F4C|nr:SUKH-4 family immunity protein [Streptomyces kronopolitis]MCL6298108.1 SUKH-4 family immunity protein [Streptomyces kronopolitis]
MSSNHTNDGGAPLGTGIGYTAVCRYLDGEGAEHTQLARSGPGRPHPEWQLIDHLAQLGIRPEDVVELYTELQACALPGGNCAALVVRSWPRVQVSHTVDYGTDARSRARAQQKLYEHAAGLARREGKPLAARPGRLPLPPRPEGAAAPVSVGPAAARGEVLDAFGAEAVVRRGAEELADSALPESAVEVLTGTGLPSEFAPFFRMAPTSPAAVDLPTWAELSGDPLKPHLRESYDSYGYLRIGEDFGREICVEPATGKVWAVELRSGWASFVNSDLESFARCLALLKRRWAARRGMGPAAAAQDTARFQQDLAALDPQSLAGPARWWAMIVEQMWDGLL